MLNIQLSRQEIMLACHVHVIEVEAALQDT